MLKPSKKAQRKQSEAHLEELLHHLFRRVPKENVEVQNPSDGPVGHSRSRLQRHLWRNTKTCMSRSKLAPRPLVLSRATRLNPNPNI